MQKNTRTLTTREQDIINDLLDAVSADIDPRVSAAEKVRDVAQTALRNNEDPSEANTHRQTIAEAENAIYNLIFTRADSACEQGLKAGQVHGFRLGIQMAARSLQGAPMDMLRLLEAAGDNAAAARLIAELVGAE